DAPPNSAVDGTPELRAGIAKPLRWPPRPCLPVRSQDRVAQECRDWSGGMSAGNSSSDAAGAGALARLGYWLDQPKILAWLMLGPAVLYVIAFVGFPFVLAIALSMSDATIGNPTLDEFVGLANFAAVIQTDAFMLALRNSLVVTGGTIILLLIVATLASELLVYAFRGKRLFQMIFILPWAMPVSLAAIVWLWLLDSDFSPVVLLL